MSELDIEYSIGQAGLFNKAYRALPDQIYSPELYELATSFRANCDRVFELSATHVNLVVYSLFLAASDREVRGELDIPISHNDPDAVPGYAVAMDQRMSGLLTEQKENEEYWTQHWQLGSVHIERFINRQMMKPAGSLALLSSMTISGWMCFEALAVDLWKLLVNAFPSPLATNILKGQPAPGSDVAGRDQQRSLGLNILDKFGFDLSRSMGDVLVHQRRVNLESYVGIAKAYRTAFGAEFDADLRPEALPRLEALRNLYAHRGGIVDDTFVRRMGSTETIVPLEAGQEFFVTGLQVQDYMDEVVQAGSSLLLFADRWFREKSGDTDFQGELDFE
jgi:hypothetical protein